VGVEGVSQADASEFDQKEEVFWWSNGSRSLRCCSQGSFKLLSLNHYLLEPACLGADAEKTEVSLGCGLLDQDRRSEVGRQRNATV